MSALLEVISAEIEREGSISIARYMELALQHPQHGYYRQHDPLGTKGDFITAPEISQMFGEMIGLWCVESWRALGKPEKFILLELGAGRGTLMQDALRATHKQSAFQQALQLYFLESNETLRQMQREKLAEYRPNYIDRLDQLPELPMIFIANEFFDALPIEQFVVLAGVEQERRVILSNQRLAFSPPLTASEICREQSPLSVALMQLLARQIHKQGGAGLLIDYGYSEFAGRSTLQAVKQHQYADILSEPGKVDLTAHVDFSALRLIAEQAGLQVAGPEGQGAFLRNMGIELRAAQLSQRATPQQAAEIASALHRLTAPAEMGTLFKVMAVSSVKGAELSGFE